MEEREGSLRKVDSEISHNKSKEQHPDSSLKIQLSRTSRKAPSILKSRYLSQSVQEAESHAINIETIVEAIDGEEHLSTDSEISLPINGGYWEQAPLELSQDFFETIGDIPNMSIVEGKSITSSIASTSTQRRSKKYSKDSDIGSFVDPLTGELVISEEEEEEEEEEKEDSVLEEEESYILSEITEDNELLELLRIDDEAMEAPKIVDAADAFETFMEMEKDEVTKQETEFDWAAFEREREHKKLEIVTNEFLRDIITEVVEKSEYIDPKVLLRENLDKATLIADITTKLEQLENEQRIRIFLNRRVSEYYHRKGQYRVFAEDGPDTLPKEMEKYKESVTILDRMLGKEEAIKINSQQQIANLEQKKSMLQIQNEEKLEELEQLIRKTFAYHGERLPLVVDSLLRNMRILRDEISTVRYILIQRQHSNATLTEQLRRLEDLGNNLHMRDYECIQTEVQALDKKIEERNADLSKSRIRCNANIHFLAHIKEKQAMLKNKVKIQKLVMQQLLNEKQIARESVFFAKTERKKLRKDIRELSFQCGLLDKPALMLDYDDTVKQVKEATYRVEGLRRKHEDILRKIAKLENKCL